MNDSDLKSDNYTIGPSNQQSGTSNAPMDTVCLNSKGGMLFKIANEQFIDSKGKTIGQIKQGQQAQSLEIYDDSNKLIGTMVQQKGQAVLNDASAKAIASASRNANSSGFNITGPDGKDGIAIVTVNSPGQQQSQGQSDGLAGALERGLFGGGMGRQNSQQAGQRSLSISMQGQKIKPLLLLAFAYSLPKLMGQQGNQRRGGMRSMGMGMLGGAAAGALLGGALGGGFSGGGLSGGRGRRRGFGRI